MNEVKSVKEDFRKWLVDDLPCKQNFEELIATFDKGTFVPFIGAGPSSKLGPPDWDGLFKEMNKPFNLDEPTEKNSDYPEAFSCLYKEFKKISKDSSDFFKKLFEIVELKQTRFHPLYLRIWRFFKLCVTTNFDDAIRNAYTEYTKIKNSKTKIKLREYYFHLVKMDNFENSIVYLHGHKNINFAIIKKEDYDYFYPSVSQRDGIPILEKFLERIYKEKTIIFMGFSFSDYYVRKFLLYLAKNEKELRRKHFWITDDTCFYTDKNLKKPEEYRRKEEREEAKKEILNLYKYWEEFNIFPIVYDHAYNIFVEELIELVGEQQKIIKEGPTLNG